MKNKNLRNLLADSLQLESELYDFIVECLKKIYGEKADQAIHAFDEGLEFREWNGCIQSLGIINSRLADKDSTPVEDFEYTPKNEV
jgi:hypothetical protein